MQRGRNIANKNPHRSSGTMQVILATLKAGAGGLLSLRSIWAGDQTQGYSGHLSETLSQDKTNHCCLVAITLVSKYFIKVDVMNGEKSVCQNYHPGAYERCPISSPLQHAQQSHSESPSHTLGRLFPFPLFSLGFIQSLDSLVLKGMVNLNRWPSGSNRMGHSQLKRQQACRS